MNDLLHLAWLAPIAMAWGQMKNLMIRMSSFLITTVATSGGGVKGGSQLKVRMETWLWKNAKYVAWGPRNFFMTDAPMQISGDNRWKDLVFERPSTKTPVIFRIGWALALWNWDTGHLVFLRGSVDYVGIMKQIEQEIDQDYIEASGRKKLRGDGFSVRRCFGNNGQPDNGLLIRRGDPGAAKEAPGLPPSPSDGSGWISSFVVLHELYPALSHSRSEFGWEAGNKESHWFPEPFRLIHREIEVWLSKRSWYYDRNLNRRRGYLLTGEPGTGKSSAVEATAMKYQLPLVLPDLSSYDNEGLRTMMNEVPADCILFFEDIDAVFNGRDNITKREGPKVTFDFFINLMSGVGVAQNCLIFVSTNHPEKLDAALTRDGRIDVVVEIGLLDREGREFIASRLLDLWPDRMVRLLSENDHPMPAAKFENLCIKEAMEAFWEEAHAA